jgi:hypothetical protein
MAVVVLREDEKSTSPLQNAEPGERRERRSFKVYFCSQRSEGKVKSVAHEK